MPATDSAPSMWPQLATLSPQLHKHIRSYPQEFRGQRWYILRDESNGKHMRFNQHAYEFIGRLDGKRTVEEIWHELTGDDNVADEKAGMSQDEIILLLSQLMIMEVLRSGLPVDVKERLQRHHSEQSKRRRAAFLNPMAIRIPLLDPDKILNRYIIWLRPLFSKAGVFFWVFIVSVAALLALSEVSALSSALTRQDILAPKNLFMLSLLYPLMKVVHEFSHGFAVKMWGGEVHEMGITLLVFMPVPYVDASAAWAIRDKHKRIIVSAIGILMELFLAALAMFVWMLVEPGWIRDAAFNVMLIGTVSTILFNANPLLRFDGYYVLQDMVEIPNLYTRANRYYLYLVKRYVLGMNEEPSPVNVQGERTWFTVYGLLALCYRFFIMVVIILFLAESYFFIGVALGIWMFISQLFLPIVRSQVFLFNSPELLGRRKRAVLFSTFSIVSILMVLTLMPVPLTTKAEGIVWVPDQARVFASNEGFVSEIFVESGSEVLPGTPLIRLHAPAQETRLVVLRARRQEITLQKHAQGLNDQVQSGILDEELATVNTELAQLEERLSALLIRSEAAGRFVLSNNYELQGRYLEQGQLIAYIINSRRQIVRSVLPQSDIGLVREGVTKIEVRLAENLDNTVEAKILRETPAASTHLPSRALGAIGGGEIAISASDTQGLTAAEKVFQIELGLPADLDVVGLGGRAYIRFDHGTEPLVSQWMRFSRQLLLSRLLL